jgi:hypothetical protein
MKLTYYTQHKFITGDIFGIISDENLANLSQMACFDPISTLSDCYTWHIWNI